MEDKTTSLKKTARIAGLWYLLLVIAGIYGLKYVGSQIFVDGNAAATTNNILTHEFLFRTGIFSSITGNFIFLFLVLTLYRLLKQVNERSAKLMVMLVLLQIAISFILELFNFTSLMVLKGEVMKALLPAQRQDFGMLFLSIHTYGINILEVFWGIWLIPFGQLVYKSGFIPRIIGVLLIAGGIVYMLNCFIFLLFPAYFSFFSKFIIVSSLGEIAIMLWLLIKGIKSEKTIAV
jgi:hypothetical protein